MKNIKTIRALLICLSFIIIFFFLLQKQFLNHIDNLNNTKEEVLDLALESTNRDYQNRYQLLLNMTNTNPKYLPEPTYLLDDNNLQDFYLFGDWMRLITFVFFLWLIIRWIVLSKANKKLNSTVSSWKIPYYDMLYAGYYLIFGLITLLSNPKKIKWR
jgi:hypothetical protein